MVDSLNLGPIVRVGPNEVHISDPGFLGTLFSPGIRTSGINTLCSAPEANSYPEFNNEHCFLRSAPEV
jgi:hypothetical protein